MLINLVGPDGCGKTTQIEKLSQWIQRDYKITPRIVVKADIFDLDRFPECRFFGCDYPTLAHELLPLMKRESRAMWLFYMLAVIICHYPPQENEIILLDGYWHKHYATELAFGLDETWLKNTCAFFPEPDLTYMLDIAPQDTVVRKHERHPYESGCDFNRSAHSFEAHQKKVRRVLLDMAQEREWTIIDANRPIDAVYEDLKHRLTGPLDAFTRSLAQGTTAAAI